MDVEIGLAGQHREAVARILNVLLADEHVLYLRLRNYHWNVVGPNFHSLHEAFEAQYTDLAPMIDELAERIRQLGHRASGTMAEVLQAARLQEEPGVRPDANGMLVRLVQDHETIIRELRAAITKVVEVHQDDGSADLLVATMEKHEKMAWLLRAHLERAG